MAALSHHLVLVVIMILVLLSYIGMSTALSNGCSDVCDFNEWAKDARCQQRNLVTVPQECKNAKTLQVQDNRIAQLVKGSFANFTCLKYLYMERNNMTAGSGSFVGCSMVERIHLSDNQLPTLTADIMKGLSKVLIMLIDNAGVQDILSGAFQNLTELQFLSLNRNKLTRPPCEAFTRDNNLQTLYLTGNKISGLRDECFSGLPKLTNLYLNDNPITYINAKAFRGLSSLKHLDLQNTGLSDIPTGIFPYANKIETLYLSNNNIQYLSNRDFVGLSGLKKLYLQHNRLNSIHHQSFEFLSSLEILDLSYNLIRSIGENALHEQSHLIELRLQNNSLKSTKNITFSAIPHDAKIHLANNPLHCDCSIYPFQYWLERATEMATDEQSSPSYQARCSSPNKLAGQLIVELNHEDICSPSPATVTTRKTGNAIMAPSIDNGNDVGYNAKLQQSAAQNDSATVSNIQLIAIVAGCIVCVILIIGGIILFVMTKRARAHHYAMTSGHSNIHQNGHIGNISITDNPLEYRPDLPPRDNSHRIPRSPSTSSRKPLLSIGQRPSLEIIEEGNCAYTTSLASADAIPWPARPTLSTQSSDTSNPSSTDPVNSNENDVFYDSVVSDDAQHHDMDDDANNEERIGDWMKKNLPPPHQSSVPPAGFIRTPPVVNEAGYVTVNHNWQRQDTNA